MARNFGTKVVGGSRLIAGSLALDGSIQNLAVPDNVRGIELLSVVVQAYKDINTQSTNNIAIVADDPATGAAAQGFILAPGENITIKIRNAANIRVIGTAGDGLIWFGVVQ